MSTAWTLKAIVEAVANLVIVACFLLTPFALQVLFRKQRIGHVLEKWIDAISAVFLLCAVHWAMHSLLEFFPSLDYFAYVMNLVTAGLVFAATGYLMYRKWKLLGTEASGDSQLRSTLSDLRVMVETRGHDERRPPDPFEPKRAA